MSLIKLGSLLKSDCLKPLQTFIHLHNNKQCLVLRTYTPTQVYSLDLSQSDSDMKKYKSPAFDLLFYSQEQFSALIKQKLRVDVPVYIAVGDETCGDYLPFICLHSNVLPYLAERSIENPLLSSLFENRNRK